MGLHECTSVWYRLVEELAVNPIFEAIQDAMVASLETDESVWLPYEFSVTIDDAAFQVLLKGLVYTQTGKKLEPTLKRVLLEIQGYRVTVHSDKDPDPWLPMTREEGLH